MSSNFIYTFTPLAGPTGPVRDPGFCTPAQAEAVAETLSKAPGGPVSINAVQATPPAPNRYADDNIYILLNFTLQQDVVDPNTSRTLSEAVTYSSVAGILVGLNEGSPMPNAWKFTPSLQDGVWKGDVEKAG